MSVYKDGNKWRVIYRYTDSRGERKQSQKRGFSTKKEALVWEREQMNKKESSLDMTFESFSEIYFSDMQKRLKENTYHTKEHILRTKLIPFFGKRKMCDIQPKDVVAWQNEMLSSSTKSGTPYSPVYLKTLHNQLSAVFNYAVRFYGLKENPAQKAGNMGKAKNREMLFWTQDEYQKFSEVMMDKPVSFYAFEMLYWCGIREGELLALTPADFDFEKQTVSITKSYQRINRQDVITEPKTPKSNRVIKMPDFLSDEIQDFIGQLYDIGENDRLFEITKSYLHHEMDRGSKIAGVKRIRIHDLRHSHISLLIEMGFSAVAIADRVGHESIDITYRYAHLFPSTQNEMAGKLSGLRNEGGDADVSEES
ncbi:MAG: site-specific integrase [Ruminococcus sp.]|nr:site-specific integrase [Ruminococcus sp.]